MPPPPAPWRTRKKISQPSDGAKPHKIDEPVNRATLPVMFGMYLMQPVRGSMQGCSDRVEFNAKQKFWAEAGQQ
jgi:hypothetical protein